VRKEADSSRMAEGAPQLRVPAGPLASLLRPSDAFKAQPEISAGQKRKRDATPPAVKSPPKVLLAQP